MAPEIKRTESPAANFPLEGFDLMHPERGTPKQRTYFSDLTESIDLKMGRLYGDQLNEEASLADTLLTPAEGDLMACRKQLAKRVTELSPGERILSAVVDHKFGINGLSIITEINWEANA